MWRTYTARVGFAHLKSNQKEEKVVKSLRRLHWSLMLALMVTLSVSVLAGCGTTDSNTGDDPEDRTLIVLQGVGTTSLDPHFTGSIPSRNIEVTIFDTLLTTNRNNELVGNLAEDWYMVDDYTWEFKIREGITFSNGEVLNAEAVKYSFDRASDPEVGSTGNTQWMLSNLNLDTVVVVDEYTVQLKTTQPNAVLPNFLGDWFVLPPEYYQNTSLEELARNPVGSGPYVVEEWQKGNYILLTAREDYWKGAPDV